jgi:hypothetical protein
MRLTVGFFVLNCPRVDMTGGEQLKAVRAVLWGAGERWAGLVVWLSG